MVRVLVAGELNADLIFSGFNSVPSPGREVLASSFSLALGSSSAICAAGLSQLGTQVSFLGKTGVDLLGEFCVAELVRMGVDGRLVQTIPGLKTGVTGSFSFEDRALVTFPGAIAELTAADIPPDVLEGFEHLHVSSYYLQTGLQSGLPGLFQTAKQLGLTVSLDPGHDPAGQWHTPGLAPVMAGCDVLFVNEVELAGLSGCAGVESGLRKIAATGCGLAVAKLGKQGCAAVDPAGTFYSSPAIDVRCVDTTGAGDSFNAGFLHLWLQGFPIGHCLDCGSICGGLSTRELGGCAGQARWPEVEAMMHSTGRYPISRGSDARH